MASKKQVVSDNQHILSDNEQLRCTFRMTAEEAQRFRALQDALQAEAGKYTRVTQRVVILEALDALEARLKVKIGRRKGTGTN